MPIVEIVGEVVGGVLRGAGQIVIEVVEEIAVRGMGYLIGRMFKRDIDADGFAVLLLGLGFWAIVGAAGYIGYTYVAEQIAIDGCLNAGGRFDYATKECIRGKA